MASEIHLRPKFPHLLSPIAVGTTQLRNRLVMGSMHTRLEHAADPVERLTAFYAARARGGVAMIVTGGVSPNHAGRMEEGAPVLESSMEADSHRPVVNAVHDAGAKILLQILHAGRYAKHDLIVGASNIPSPINPRIPRPLTPEGIESTIDDYVRCAELSLSAGFDGVEIMGSEGYLINQFTAPRTNTRVDDWGGNVANRIRFPVEIIRRIRRRVGHDFLLMFRISAIDLVEGGSTGDEVDLLAKAVEDAGADILSTGIGWHESRIPTIAYAVPPTAWRFAAARLKKVVSIPVVSSNRINSPEAAEDILSRGEGDLISMARPLLADPDFLVKAQSGRSADINRCIACNQACLDYIFSNRIATCLVNPRAGRETEFIAKAVQHRQRIAVVGAGAAGLAFAATAAERGHQVTLFESADDIGGQLNLARRIPGKHEFNELTQYLRNRINASGVDLRLRSKATAKALLDAKYDRIVIASGVIPRLPDLEGIHHPKVASYVDVLTGTVSAGQTVAIIGGGGIGFDVAEYLTHTTSTPLALPAFYSEWGIDPSLSYPGGIRGEQPPPRGRQVIMLQRSAHRFGARLGISTGWITRASLRRYGVAMIAGCTYHRIDDNGLHYSIDGKEGVIAADTVVICAGQDAAVDPLAGLRNAKIPVDVIGGAENTQELDALRAIEQGTRLGLLC